MSLEARDDTGVAQQTPARGSATAPPDFRGHLDQIPANAWVGEPLTISGWCTHQTEKICQVELVLGAARIECQHGLVREDVAAALPGWPWAGRSGFVVSLAAPPMRGPVRLEVMLESGARVVWDTGRFIRIRPRPWMQRLRGRAAKAGQFARFALGKAREKVRQRGIVTVLKDLPQLARKARAAFAMRTHRQQTLAGYTLPEPIDRYEAWLAVNRWTESRADDLRRRIVAAGVSPKISVVMPVYNPPLVYLDEAIASVRGQVYDNWELCIADDCSTDPAVNTALEQWAKRDPRIKVTFRAVNGNISEATNSAAELATGDFLSFLDNDDVLTPDALGECALYLAANGTVDYLYSDDDKIDQAGKRYMPQFKPDWSPELLLSYMYMAHLIVVRKTLWEQVGGCRRGFEGSQDYDFALRATEKARKIGHLPLILYHWRAIPGSTASSGAAKPASFEAGRRAVQEALQRRGSTGQVAQPAWARRAGLGLFGHTFSDEGPAVTLIIPTKNNLDVLRRCIDSLSKTTYRNYRVLIVDNESDDPKTLAYLAALEPPRFRVLRVASRHGQFNFSHLNNQAVQACDTEYVLLLNNDTEVRDPGWLSQMMGYAQLPGVGAVGARLLYPNLRVQHAGIVHGLHHGLAGHAFKHALEEDAGYLCYAKVARNYSGVTAACMLTPRQLYVEMGGLDEENFAVAYNDVDYCYRLVDRGRRCVYAPAAELLHHEGASRGFIDNPREAGNMRRKYLQRVDPYYPAALALDDEQMQIRPIHRVAGPVRTLRAVCVGNGLDLTGGPLHQLDVLARLKATGVLDPLVFAPADGPLRARFEALGIQVIAAEHPLADVLAGKRTYEQAIAGFARWLQQEKADVVYGNTLEAFYGIEAARAAGIPSVWNVHESEPFTTYFARFGQAIAGEALACFQWPYRVIFVSEATRQAYRPLESRHNFTVIHNGLDYAALQRAAAGLPRAAARARLNVAASDAVILLLGTVCERKGQLDLAQALAHLPAEWHERVRVFIVGDRPSAYSRSVHQAVQALPAALRARATIVRETHEVLPYYRAADIFVCTSRVESFPRVILEAMACGVAIVTTPVWGIAEQVQPEVNGLFYTPGAIRELAAALVRLLESPALREKFVDHGLHVLRRLNSYEDMTDAYTQIFREAYGAGGR